MTSEEKRRRRRWMFYFLIQLPIATCAIRGITIPKLFPLDKKEPYTFIEIPDGEYTLYSTQEAIEIGNILIVNKDDCVMCSVVANAYTECDSILGKEHKYSAFDKKNISLSFREDNKSKFLMADIATSIIVIVNISWDDSSLPDDLQGNPLRNYYLLSEMTYERYRFSANFSSLDFAGSCLVGAYEDMHSYIFFVDR